MSRTELRIVGVECAQGKRSRLEASLLGLCFASPERREGSLAFFEKGKPVLRGR